MRFKKEMLFLLVFAILCVNTATISFGEDSKVKNTDYRIVEKNKVWKIEFTSTVDLTYVNDETVYIKSVDGGKLDDCEIRIKNDKIITITRDGGFEEGQLYELVVKDDIRNIDGEKLKSGRKILFKIEGETRGDFHVKRAEFISKKNILIEFSKDVDVTAEVPVFYELKDENGVVIKGSYDNFSIKSFDEDEKILIMSVENKEIDLESDVFLKVSGELVDKKRERFNEGKSDWIVVKGLDKKVSFGVQEVNFIGNRILEVKFNSAVSKKEAEKESNFRLYDPNDNSMIIDKCILYDGQTLRINLKSKIEDVGEFTLNIKNMKDFTGYFSMKNKDVPFEVDGIYENKIKYSAKALNKRMVELKFDEKLNPVSARKTYNYFIITNDEKESAYISSSLYFDENTKNRVVLYFPFDMMDPDGYRVKVMRTLENEFGDNYDVESKYTIESSSKSYIFDLLEARDGEDYVELEFSSEIFQNEDVMRKENYELILDDGDGRTITIKCDEVVMIDGKTIRATFNGMRDGESYKMYTPLFQGYFGGQAKFITGIEIDR